MPPPAASCRTQSAKRIGPHRTEVPSTVSPQNTLSTLVPYDSTVRYYGIGSTQVKSYCSYIGDYKNLDALLWKLKEPIPDTADLKQVNPSGALLHCCLLSVAPLSVALLSVALLSVALLHCWTVVYCTTSSIRLPIWLARA